MPDHQRGQATPIMAMLLVVAAVIGLLIVQLGSRAVDAARARTAADAAALAGAADGPDAARSVAGADRGTLVRFQQLGNDVVVEVTVGSARAEARARATWPLFDPGGRHDSGPKSTNPYTSDDGP